MKSFLILNLAIGLNIFTATSVAFAGGVSDGGGNAVVCRDANKNITSATLLDLYEAEKVLKLQIIPNDPNKTYLQLAEEAGQRIDVGGAGIDVVGTYEHAINGQLVDNKFGIMPKFAKSIVQDGVVYVNQLLNLISGAGLAPINDFQTIIVPKNCQIEQTVVYLDESEDIHVVEEIWNAFDNVNKAALLVHEALYKSMRQSGETNSNRTRAAVGHAFTGSIFKHILDGIPESVMICGTSENAPKYRFAVYEEQPGSTTIQFLWLNNKIMLSKTTLKVATSESPIEKLKVGSSSTDVYNLTESIFDKKLKIALKQQKNAADDTEAFVGLITNVITDDVLFKVHCNRTTFHCDEKSCDNTIGD